MDTYGEMRALRARYQANPLVHKRRQYLRAWVWYWAFLDEELQVEAWVDLARWAGQDAVDALYWAVPWYDKAYRVEDIMYAADALCLAFVFFYGQLDARPMPSSRSSRWVTCLLIAHVGRVDWFKINDQFRVLRTVPRSKVLNAAIRPAGGDRWYRRQRGRGHHTRWTCMALGQLTHRKPVTVLPPCRGEEERQYDPHRRHRTNDGHRRPSVAAVAQLRNIFA